MAFSPSSIVCSAPSLAHQKVVYLSRASGYDVSIIPSPSVVDPVSAGDFSVVIERSDGQKASVGLFKANDDLSLILKRIKEVKWAKQETNVIPAVNKKPSPDMVEYILKFKKEQDEKNAKAGLSLDF